MMEMKRIVAILLLGSTLSIAQQTTEIDSLQLQTVQVTDTLLINTTEGDIPTTTAVAQVRDTLMYQLADDPFASKVDSLWLNDLYSNELFEEMYGTITEMPLEPEEVEYEELPTEVLKQRLQELNARTPFNVEYNPTLERVIKSYLKNRRNSLARLMALSNYYFPMFEETLDRYDLPLEMKYLAIVESALNPRARSRVGAKGLWQFMFSTGRLFDLGVSSYVDERSDPHMATEAASRYLKQLYENLGDWDLALAAYNSGPGNVSKAIRRSGGMTNYWNIRGFLPRETAGYVPAFLATMYIFEYAEEHGFDPKARPPMHFPATDTVKVKKMITLEQVAVVTNMDIEELEFLNPSYKLGIIPVIEGKEYTLRLPTHSLGKFVQNEEAIYAYAQSEFDKREKPLPRYYDQNDKIRYRVRNGDYLGKIAARYGVSVRQIKNWNGLRSNNIRVGQRLTIYPRKFEEPVAQETTKPKSSSTEEVAQTYTVRQGDSLWSISRKFPGVSVDNLKKWNDISGTKLKPGMKLRIYKG